MFLSKKFKKLKFFSRIIFFTLYTNKRKSLSRKKNDKIKSFLSFKKENVLKINNQIELCFNTNEKKEIYDVYKENFFKNSFILYFFIKQKCLLLGGRKKQYFYSILSLNSLLFVIQEFLNKKIWFSSFSLLERENINGNWIFLPFCSLKEQKRTRPGFCVQLENKKKQYITTLLWSKYRSSFILIYFQIYFLYLSSVYQMKDIKNPLTYVFLPNFTFLENKLIKEYIFTQKYGFKLKTLFSQKEILALFLGRTSKWNIFLNNSNFSFFIFERLLKRTRLNVFKLSAKKKKAKFAKEISSGFIYFIMRLEEKFKEIKDVNLQQMLLVLRNMLLKKMYNTLKNNSTTRYFLSNLKELDKKLHRKKRKNLSFFAQKSIFFNNALKDKMHFKLRQLIKVKKLKKRRKLLSVYS